MPEIALAEVSLPDFGLPASEPDIAASLYEARYTSLMRAAAAQGLDGLLIYADREHCANLAYLTGFDPLFEEAIMLAVPGWTPLIATGPENQARASASKIAVDVALYPPFGLLGQDRSRTPPLADLLAQAGIARGARIGVIGWKYYSTAETATPDAWIEAPSFIVDTLRHHLGSGGSAVNATSLLMHASRGLRAINEIDQLARFEFAASHASEAVKRMIFGLRPGMTEFEAVSLMRLNGYPLSCHTMMSTGPHSAGLIGPSGRVIQTGEPVTSCVGLWGSLTARAGWVAADAADLPAGISDYVERLAAPYFACVVDWYETIGIGVPGGEIDALARRHLGDPFFNLILNPGHLVHIDEWMNTPIYPGSTERLQSGQAIQCDIIPAAGPPYYTANVEDGLALLDAAGRAAFSERHPDAWARIQVRRAFMRDVLGIKLKDEVLPFSNMPGYLTPFFLSPTRALRVA
jgi:Xaa-Pro aminopeptidase